MDIGYAIKTNRVFEKLLTMDMPTLGVLNGHTIAAGVLIALCHDRLIMTSKPKTILLLNELENGIAMTAAQARIPMETLSPQTGRLLLGGYRLTP